MNSNPLGDWVGYWNQDVFWRNLPLWQINARIFVDRFEKIIEFKKDDVILNIGCGMGYLEEILAPKVGCIVAVDIAQQFVDACSERCTSCHNVRGVLLAPGKIDFSALRERFSLILCISVVQYYAEISELEDLILAAKKVALPGAKMLVGDLPLRRGKIGFIWDALCSFLLSIQGGYLRELFRAGFSEWKRRLKGESFSNKARQLYFTFDEIETLIKRMELKARILRQEVSVYAHRPSLLIEF